MNIMRTKGFKTLKKYWKPIVLLLLLFFPINCNGVFYYKGIRGCNDLLIEGVDKQEENEGNGENRDGDTLSCLQDQFKNDVKEDKLQRWNINKNDSRGFTLINRWLPEISYNDSGFTVIKPSSTDPSVVSQMNAMSYICNRHWNCTKESTLLNTISKMCNDFFGDTKCLGGTYDLNQSINNISYNANAGILWKFFPLDMYIDNNNNNNYVDTGGAGNTLIYNSPDCQQGRHTCEQGVWKFYDSSDNEINNWYGSNTDLIIVGAKGGKDITKATCSDASIEAETQPE